MEKEDLKEKILNGFKGLKVEHQKLVLKEIDGWNKKRIRIESNEKYGNVVSSRVIANELGKRHSHVLRDIENILESQQNQESPNLDSLIFENCYRVNNQNRTYKEYLLTKDGFTLYMFNIQGYIDFKLAYINEFNRMENELRQKKIPNMNEYEDRNAYKALKRIYKYDDKISEYISYQKRELYELKMLIENKLLDIKDSGYETKIMKLFLGKDNRYILSIDMINTE